MSVYNNLMLEEFIGKVEQMTSIPANLVSLKVVDDTMIRRIDRQIWNIDDPNVKNRLKDLKIVDNTAILVEMKDEQQVEMEKNEPVYHLEENGKKTESDFIDIDSTENIRTVIV